jgi:hypothetical protein
MLVHAGSCPIQTKCKELVNLSDLFQNCVSLTLHLLWWNNTVGLTLHLQWWINTVTQHCTYNGGMTTLLHRYLKRFPFPLKYTSTTSALVGVAGSHNNASTAAPHFHSGTELTTQQWHYFAAQRAAIDSLSAAFPNAALRKAAQYHCLCNCCKLGEAT